MTIYATPREVTELANCRFYHTMELPGLGTVEGEWDLRKGLTDYLGEFTFNGRRVLDVGAANGALTFYMERQGAEVVSFDLDREGEWDLVPFANWANYEDIAKLRRRHLDRMNNAYWLAHRLLRSNARMAYGSVYRIPKEIGRVDVSVFGSILLHLRDPFLALYNGLRLTGETAIVTDLLGGESLPKLPLMRFLPDANTMEPKGTWWDLSPEIIVAMLGVLGFRDTHITHHKQSYQGPEMTLFTVVGRRRDGAPIV